ncbi:MAG: GGDEF domain-containing protein, partial [Pirellula sp.]
MDEQFAKFRSTQQPFTLALLDIDHFKKINDTYGHASGDEVLREVGARLREISDQCNLIARYGGEEFAVVFNVPLAQAAKVMEHLRARGAATPVRAEGTA